MVESGGEMALWRHSMAPCCHGAVALHALQQGGFEGGQKRGFAFGLIKIGPLCNRNWSVLSPN
jgi:hypothetical protein